jgi:hypothetical protein
MAPYLFTVDQDKTIKIAAATVVVLEATERESAKSYTEATTSLIL